ncbi:MAG: hypothetical protein Q7R83_00580 [bacterium]|nr:hypothetical protein [bacterium]
MSTTEQHFRLAEIEVSKSTLDEKIIGIFRYESEMKTRKAPIFVLLVECDSNAYVYEQLLDVLNNAAEQARRLTVHFDGDPMARFEKVIQRLNEALSTFVETAATPIAWNRVNIFALELCEGHLCFCGVGHLTNVFLQRQNDGAFRSFDLFGSLEQPVEPNPKKVFSSLVCGDMNPGDVLFAGTQNLERLRGELRLTDRLGTLPPVTAAVEIQQEIESREIPDDFAGLIIACVELPKSAAAFVEEEPLKEKSTTSVQKMQEEEQAAEAFLSPTISPVTKSGKKITFTSLLESGRGAIANAWSSFIQRMKKPRTKPLRDPVTLASLRGMNAGVGTFMTRKRKLTLLAGGLVIVAAIVGTFVYRAAKKSAAEQAMWNASYDQAVDRKNRAEADLVYGNEAHALRLVNEATELLKQLDEKTNARKTAKDDLVNELAQVQTKLKHQTVVEHPTEIFSLPTNTTPDQAPRHLALVKNNLYLVDVAGSAVVGVNPDTKEVKRIGLTSDENHVTTMTAGANGPLLLTATGTLLAADPVSGKVKTIALGSKNAQGINSMLVYNKRLYALDPAKNMIWKYGASGDGFGAEATYLKQTNSALAESSAVTIDSNVYVGFKNGKMTRYLSGVEEVWAPNVIEPPLASVASLWTAPDTDRLIVADTAGKRIVVFRKDGQLISQITSPDFQGPVSVTADVTLKKIYVLDGLKVFSVDLP